eukprot:scaffold451_cov184-Amphora_coffeaeformis.AAC.6
MVDATVVTSPQIQKEFQDHGVPNCFLWEKGIDTQRFHPSFRNAKMRDCMTDSHPDDFLITYIGRLGKEKRLKELRDILERMPNARLCIVGHGPYEQELHKYFEGSRTVFTGLLYGDKLSQAFATADAFCMPSDSETLGFVCLKCSSGAGKIPWRNFATEPMKLPDKTSTSDGKIVFGESLPYMACVNGSSMVRDYHPTDMSRLVRDHIVNAYHHHGIQVGGYVPSQLPGTDRIQTSSDLP